MRQPYSHMWLSCWYVLGSILSPETSCLWDFSCFLCVHLDICSDSTLKEVIFIIHNHFYNVYIYNYGDKFQKHLHAPRLMTFTFLKAVNTNNMHQFKMNLSCSQLHLNCSIAFTLQLQFHLASNDCKIWQIYEWLLVFLDFEPRCP
jgi:hypothetical protein